MYTYRRSKLAKTKLIHVSYKCETLLYPCTDEVYLGHCILYELQQEMLQKHVEIY